MAQAPVTAEDAGKETMDCATLPATDACPLWGRNPVLAMRAVVVPAGMPPPQIKGWAVWGSTCCPLDEPEGQLPGFVGPCAPPPVLAGLLLQGPSSSAAFVAGWLGAHSGAVLVGGERAIHDPRAPTTLAPTSSEAASLPPPTWGPGLFAPSGPPGCLWPPPRRIADLALVDEPGSEGDGAPPPLRGGGGAVPPPTGSSVSGTPPKPGWRLGGARRSPPSRPSAGLRQIRGWVQDLVGVPLGGKQRPLPRGSDFARIIQRIRGQALPLALTAEGGRVLQQLLVEAPKLAWWSLIGDLETDFVRVCQSLHGNYVVQALITGFSSRCGGRVAEALEGHCREVATHRCGCRIFCRLFEHAGGEPATKRLANELLKIVAGSGSGYLHYPFASLLEHGSERQKDQAIEALVGRLGGGGWPEGSAVSLVSEALYPIPPGGAARVKICAAVVEAERASMGGSPEDALTRGLDRPSTRHLFKEMGRIGTT